MTSTILFAQLANQEMGWLTRTLLGVTLSSAEWVLWVLAILSIVSIAVMLERAIFYLSNGVGNPEDLRLKLAKGDLEGVKAAISGKTGMEAEVLRQGIEWSSKGPDAVEEIINATTAREKPRYERFVWVLGTLGSNSPFIGLFGTVLGIIKSFNDLGATGAKGAAVQQTVMTGISEALVATAVGLAVAIPAVIGYNILSRSLKNVMARSTALGHALVGQLRAGK